MICSNCGSLLEDGAKFCVYCGTAQNTAPVEETPAAKPTPKKKTKIIVAVILISVLLLGAAAAAGVYFWMENEKSVAYDEAVELLEKGKIEKALAAFEELGDYEDAPDMVESLTDYKKALKMLDNHKYDEAQELFEELGGFHDSKTYADGGVDYHKANYILQCAENGDADALAWTDYNMNDYDDERRLSCDLYWAAAELFEELGDYQDSEALAEECFDAAELLESELNSEDLQNAILGTWIMNITLTEEMLQTEGANIEDLPMNLTFDEYGECTLFFSDESIQIFEEKMLAAAVEVMYTQMEAEGVSRDELDELFESYYGVNVADYLKQALAEADVMSMLAELEEIHDYEVEDGMLIIDGTAMTVEINGDKLTISDCEDDDFWSALGLKMPIVMERAD